MILRKTLAALSMLVMTVALSCTDHVGPVDPGQSNCLRVNGSPRLYPCEFEIVQIDVMSGSSNTDVYATLTPGNHNVHLLTTEAFSYNRTGTTTATLEYKIRLHVKRIASPAFPNWSKSKRRARTSSSSTALLRPPRPASVRAASHLCGSAMSPSCHRMPTSSFASIGISLGSPRPTISANSHSSLPAIAIITSSTS